MNTLSEVTKPSPRQGSRVGLVLAIIGAWMQLGPFVGLAGTVLGMMRAFHELGSSGIGDPSTLAKSIGEVLISTMVGMAASLVGVALMLIGFVVYQCRQRWLVWLLVCVGILWLMVVPGMVFLVGANSDPSKSSTAVEARP